MEGMSYKHLILDLILNMLPLLFVLAKVHRVFKKPIRVLTENISQTCGIIFPFCLLFFSTLS